MSGQTMKGLKAEDALGLKKEPLSGPGDKIKARIVVLADWLAHWASVCLDHRPFSAVVCHSPIGTTVGFRQPTR